MAHYIEHDRLDGCKVDDLEFFGFGETKGGEAFGQALDALGYPQRGLIVGCEGLDGCV